MSSSACPSALNLHATRLFAGKACLGRNGGKRSLTLPPPGFDDLTSLGTALEVLVPGVTWCDVCGFRIPDCNDNPWLYEAGILLCGHWDGYVGAVRGGRVSGSIWAALRCRCFGPAVNFFVRYTQNICGPSVSRQFVVVTIPCFSFPFR
jgi:hypothetical protein